MRTLPHINQCPDCGFHLDACQCPDFGKHYHDGGPVAEYSATDPTDHIEGEIVRAGGLCSMVLDADSEPIGHVRMLDFDDTDNIMAVCGELDRSPGISVLLESSPGSYHGYTLSIAPIQEHAYQGLKGESDPAHLRASARRGYFVLRWTGKQFEDGSTYKSEPEPLRVINTPSEEPQSEPHARMLLQRARETGAEQVEQDLLDAMDQHELAGEGHSIDYYETCTDSLKEDLSNG